MAEYYNADTLLEFVKNNTPHMDGNTTMQCVEWSIKEAPTADVKEVKRGRWKHSESPLGWQDVDVAICSVCDEEWVLDEWDIKEFSLFHNFCPMCGADMRGDTDESL